MSLGLLWIEALLISLLWVAMLAACIARAKTRWVRTWTTAVVILIPFLALAPFVGFTGVLDYGLGLEPNWFYYSLSLLIGYVAGMIVILRSARRRPEPGLAIAAQSWPRLWLALAWVAAVAVGNMTLWNMDLSRAQQAALTEIQAGAMFAPLVPPAVPDSQNAALVYDDAFARLENDPAAKAKDSPLGDDAADINGPAVAAILKRQERTIDLLHRAAQLPACRFDRDWSRLDIGLMMPNLNDARLAADVLQLHACVEAAQGRSAYALTDIDAMIQLARHIGEEPILISGLVSMSLHRIAVATLQDVLPVIDNAAQLDGLKLEDPASIRRMFRRTLAGEECIAMALFGQIESGERAFYDLTPATVAHPPIEQYAPSWSIFRILFLSWGLEDYTRLMEGYKDAAGKPYYQARDDLSRLRLSWNDARQKGLFFAVFTPAYFRAIDASSEAQATAACAQTAVAMTRYRLDHGALPARVEDLVPAYLEAVPLDPFDGQPLRLAIRNDQWIIYSIGPDLKDDGGVAMDNHRLGDIIFTLRSAKH
jgi:hypothetical protein